MRFGTIGAIAVAVMAASVLGARDANANDTPATMVIQEEFCGPRTTCGTVTGSLGKGTNMTVINTFTYVGGGCFHDVHTTTAAFEDGRLVFSVDGRLCAAPSPGTFKFTGSWSVVGGTGLFAGATGGGEARAFRENGPIHAIFVGTLA